MKKLIAYLLPSIIIASSIMVVSLSPLACSSNVPAVVVDGFDCVAEAAAAAAKKIDVVTAVEAITKIIVDAVTNPSSLIGLIESAITTYGPGIVACTVNAVEQAHTPQPAAGSGVKLAEPDDVGKLAAQVMQAHNWKIASPKK